MRPNAKQYGFRMKSMCSDIQNHLKTMMYVHTQFKGLVSHLPSQQSCGVHRARYYYPCLPEEREGYKTYPENLSRDPTASQQSRLGRTHVSGSQSCALSAEPLFAYLTESLIYPIAYNKLFVFCLNSVDSVVGYQEPWPIWGSYTHALCHVFFTQQVGNTFM